MNTQQHLPAIAIAEDHPLFLRSLEALVKEMTDVVHVFSAPDGQDLLQYMKSAKALPDIVILDIGMKKLNGFYTLSYIREHWPQVKAIIHSGYDLELYVDQSIKLGALAFLSKSSEGEELQAAIRSVWCKGYYYSGSFTIERKALIEKEKVKLRPKEERFLSLIHLNDTYEGLAAKMNLPCRTVETMKYRLFKKLKVNTRHELLLKGIKLGYIPLGKSVKALFKM